MHVYKKTLGCTMFCYSWNACVCVYANMWMQKHVCLYKYVFINV